MRNFESEKQSNFKFFCSPSIKFAKNCQGRTGITILLESDLKQHYFSGNPQARADRRQRGGALPPGDRLRHDQVRVQAWSPDGYSRILRSYVFGLSGFWTMAPLRYAAKFDPFLSLDCAPMPSTLAQSKERKGSNFAIWQPCCVFNLQFDLPRPLLPYFSLSSRFLPPPHIHRIHEPRWLRVSFEASHRFQMGERAKKASNHEARAPISAARAQCARQKKSLPLTGLPLAFFAFSSRRRRCGQSVTVGRRV